MPLKHLQHVLDCALLDHSEAIMDAGCLCADIVAQLERKTHGLEYLSFHISNLPATPCGSKIDVGREHVCPPSSTPCTQMREHHESVLTAQ